MYVTMCNYVCVSTIFHTIITYNYVHVLQVFTKKQAVFCFPHLFIADTLNTVSPVNADGHTSVC